MSKKRESFTDAVKEVVKQIPPGKTMSYRAVAMAAGRPRACRAVGNTMARNYDLAIPCHRVIHTNGRAGGYNRGGSIAKLKKLRNEKEEE